MVSLDKLNVFFLYLLVFSVTFEFWSPFGLEGVLSITKIVTVLYIISSLSFIKERLSLKYLGIYIRPLLIFLLVEFLSSVIYIEYITDFDNISTTRVFKFILLLLLISNHVIAKPEIIDKILQTYIFSIVLISVLFFFGIGVDLEFLDGESRLILFGENPNGVGIKAVIGIMIIFSFILEKKNLTKTKKIFFFLSLVPILALISATASRGAILSLFIGTIIMVLLLRKSLNVKVPIIITAGILGIFVTNYFLTNEVFYERIMLTVDEGETGRNDLWVSSFNIFLDSPYFGVGRSGFKPLMKVYYGYAMGAHNAFLEILATTGIFGFTAFMVFYLRMLKFSYKNYLNTKSILFLLLFSIITLHIFKAGGAMSSTFVWFIFALIIGSTRMMENSDQDKSLIYKQITKKI